MSTYRISYRIEGQKEREQVEWRPAPNYFNMEAFTMGNESPFPRLLYSDTQGMEAVLCAHGITDIRSPDVTSE